MAYLPNSEEEKDQKSAEGSDPSQVPLLSGDSGSLDGSTTPGPTSAKADPTATHSGSYTNLTNYLQANQGAGGVMGQGITNSVAGDAGKATTAIGTFGTNAASAVDAGTVKDTGVVAGLKSDPTKVDKEAFTKQANASYAGPNDASSIDGYGDALTGSTKVAQDVKDASGGIEGRNNLVKAVYDRPSYTRGEQNLDSFLVGGDEQGAKALNDISTSYGAFDKNLTGASDTATARIKAGQDTTAKTKADTNQAFTDARSGLDTKFTGLQAGLTDSNTAKAKTYQGAVNGMASPDAKVRADAYKSIGLDPTEGEWLRGKGYDPAKIISSTKAQSLGDVADTGDVNNYSALLNLIGATPGYDFSKAGGSANAFDVNSADVGSGKSAMDLENQITAAVKAEQAKRDTQTGNLANGFNSFNPAERDASYRALGINPDDEAFMIQNGIDPMKYVTSGAKVTAGNVTTAAQASQYAALMKALGINGSNMTPSGPAGSAYTYNSSTAAQDVAAKKAAIAAAVTTPNFQATPTDNSPDPATPGGYVNVEGGPNSPDQQIPGQQGVTGGLAKANDYGKKRGWW